MTIVRDATDADMPAVCSLYNALIPTTTIAWSERLETLDERVEWFAGQQARKLPVLVAEDGGTVVGFTSYGSFRGEGKWPGYRFTVEHTIHVARSQWGNGVGRLLLESLIDRAQQVGLHVMVGAVDGDNHASIRFHERLGFTEVARMPQVGQKFGRWLDLVMVERILSNEE
jgi:L-amino acid N-acyltransferase